MVSTQTSVRVHLARMEQPARMLSMATAVLVWPAMRECNVKWTQMIVRVDHVRMVGNVLTK